MPSRARNFRAAGGGTQVVRGRASGGIGAASDVGDEVSSEGMSRSIHVVAPAGRASLDRGFRPPPKEP